VYLSGIRKVFFFFLSVIRVLIFILILFTLYISSTCTGNIGVCRWWQSFFSLYGSLIQETCWKEKVAIVPAKYPTNPFTSFINPQTLSRLAHFLRIHSRPNQDTGLIKIGGSNFSILLLVVLHSITALSNYTQLIPN
jgi:hypothetical protein